MKNFFLAAAASIALIAGASSAQAQDRGYRSPQRGYSNNNGYGSNDRWNDDDDRRYRDYNQGAWQMRNGNYWNGNRRMSPSEYQRWRRWQRSRGNQNAAYYQGVRDGRQSAYRNNNRGRCGNGRNGRW